MPDGKHLVLNSRISARNGRDDDFVQTVDYFSPRINGTHRLPSPAPAPPKNIGDRLPLKGVPHIAIRREAPAVSQSLIAFANCDVTRI